MKSFAQYVEAKQQSVQYHPETGKVIPFPTPERLKQLAAHDANERKNVAQSDKIRRRTRGTLKEQQWPGGVAPETILNSLHDDANAMNAIKSVSPHLYNDIKTWSTLHKNFGGTAQ